MFWKNHEYFQNIDYGFTVHLCFSHRWNGAGTEEEDQEEDQEEDEAKVLYWAAAACQWVADDKAEARRHKDKAEARREALLIEMAQ